MGSRDNFTGEWIPASKHTSVPFNIPEEEPIVSLSELMERAKTEEDKEGWVIRFPDIMVKQKTEWYFRLHGLRTENVFRADYVIKNYLGKTLDDLMSQLDPVEDEDAFAFVKEVTNAIDNYLAHVDACAFELKAKYEKHFGPDKWHYFAKFHNKEPYFGLARNLIETPGDYNRRKIEMVLKRTYRLKNAEQLVEKWKS